MKTIGLTKVLLVCVSIVLLPILLAMLGLVEVKREIANDRKRSERAVGTTVTNITSLGLLAQNVEAITNAVIAPASVEILGGDPAQFKVHAMTGWPDVMIYEYDSNDGRKPKLSSGFTQVSTTQEFGECTCLA